MATSKELDQSITGCQEIINTYYEVMVTDVKYLDTVDDEEANTAKRIESSGWVEAMGEEVSRDRDARTKLAEFSYYGSPSDIPYTCCLSLPREPGSMKGKIEMRGGCCHE